MLEKRKYPRFALSAEVQWKSESAADDNVEPFVRQTRDLSTGGICLDLAPGVCVGDTLLLEIRLPGYQVIYTKGKVVWVNTGAHIKAWTIPACEGGIELLNLSEPEKARIDGFITQSIEN